MKKTMIAFTGAHGTGKSTAAHKHYLGMKYCSPVFSIQALSNLEADCPYPINKETSEEAQTWLFANQIKHELSARARFDIVITDRTVIDVVAYTYVAGFHSLAQGMLAYAEQHMSYYNKIIFRKISNNEHCYPDGIRDASDRKFRQDVEDVILDFYHRLEESGLLPGTIQYV